MTANRWPIVSTNSKYWLNDVSVATDGSSVVWTEDRKFFLQRLDDSGRRHGMTLKLGSIGYDHYGLAVDVSNVISRSRQLILFRNVFAEYGSCYGHEDGFIMTLVQYDSGQLLSKKIFRPKYESSACDINSNSAAIDPLGHFFIYWVGKYHKGKIDLDGAIVFQPLNPDGSVSQDDRPLVANVNGTFEMIPYFRP